MVATLTTIRYGVVLSLTALDGSQAVDPFGRWASRTRTHPGLVAITGRTDGRAYQLSGTTPAVRRSGRTYLGVVIRTVATVVRAGIAGRGVADRLGGRARRRD